MAVISEAEALKALEAFESVGVTLFCPRLLAEETGAVEEADVVKGASDPADLERELLRQRRWWPQRVFGRSLGRILSYHRPAHSEAGVRR